MSESDEIDLELRGLSVRSIWSYSALREALDLGIFYKLTPREAREVLKQGGPPLMRLLAPELFRARQDATA